MTTPVAQNTAIKIGVPRSTGAEITTRISLLRVTGHDFVDIGTGGYATTRIPNDLYGPPVIAPDQAKEVQEIGAARVYYATTDQDGNFRVGSVFRVNQARGTVSINAPIDLTNLSSISLKKNQGPAVDEFSLDDRMAGDIGGYHNRIPTEKTIVTYINRRLGVDQRGLIYTGGTIGGGMLALNGTTPMKGALNMDGFAVSGLPSAPTNSNEAAPKGYVDSRLHRSGTSAVDTNGTTRRDDWGVMLGPLQLSGEPVVYTTATTAQVNIGVSVVPIGLSYGYYRGLGVSGHPNIATGTVVSSVQSVNSIVLSIPALGTIPSGTVLTLDPVSQAVNKSYADKKSQFNQLRDVVLTNTTDTDFLMFSNTTITPQVASGTTAAVYNTATAIVNVRNNTAPITNTSNSSAGGSDIAITRSNNTVTFKIVGGQGANNPITDHHINNSAAIAQSKLSMKKADTSAASSNLQSDLGLAQFNNVEFSATNGWVSLLSSTNSTTGIAPSKLQQVSGATGGFLGRTSAGAVDYQTSGTIRTWLQVLGLEGGALNGNLTVSGNAGVTGAVGIGTVSPATLLHVSGTSSTAITRIQNTGIGASTFNGSGAGLELLAAGMNTTSKYTPALKFGSTDSDFITTIPKFGAEIIEESI